MPDDESDMNEFVPTYIESQKTAVQQFFSPKVDPVKNKNLRRQAITPSGAVRKFDFKTTDGRNQNENKMLKSMMTKQVTLGHIHGE